MDTCGKAFVEHWDWVAKQGLMNEHTANSLRTASQQVLGVMDDWENVDVREIDVEEILTRFQNLRNRDFKPRTLNAYMSRFKQAVAYFLEYVENPASWKSPTTQRRTATQPKSNNGQKSQSRSTAKVETGSEPRGYEGNLVEYPYPLREDLVVYLNLPRDLTLIEVKRLMAYMRTLTVDFEVDNEI